jgi:hypothetical protein
MSHQIGLSHTHRSTAREWYVKVQTANGRSFAAGFTSQSLQRMPHACDTLLLSTACHAIIELPALQSLPTPGVSHQFVLLPVPLLLCVLPDSSACSYTSANRQVSCNLGSVAPGAPAKVVWIVANVVASSASHTYGLTGTTASNGPVSQAPKACTVPVVSARSYWQRQQRQQQQQQRQPC